MRRHAAALAFAEHIEIPTGNVHVLPPAPGSAEPDDTADDGAGDPGGSRRTDVGWEIHDGDGAVLVPPLGSRAEALREMGVLAFRGASLPLTLYGPDGRPTGDRLA